MVKYDTRNSKLEQYVEMKGTLGIERGVLICCHISRKSFCTIAVELSQIQSTVG